MASRGLISSAKEIFDLQVFAWENSPSTVGINKENYPKGMSDVLDEKTIHWVSTNESGKIVAASRLAVINDLSELPFPQIFAGVEFPSVRPFLYYSRLVVHPKYRKLGIKEKMDKARLCYMKSKRFAFSVTTARHSRAAELLRYGWKDCGQVSQKN